MTAAEKFGILLRQNTRFDAEAYNFVYEALDYTLKHVLGGRRRANQHVSGQELLEGIRRLGIDQFGCLARPVFEAWGVQTTEDFGEIVFSLVEHDLMGKQDSDSPEDFRNAYHFDEAFDLTPVFHFSSERGEWKTSYVTRAQFARIHGWA